MRDETALRRHLILLKTLSARHYGLTIQEMATESGVAEKTIRRDLGLFRSLGFPLEETTGEFGRKTWKITSSANQLPLTLTVDEAIALHLGRRLLDPLAGTPIGDAARQAFRKIRTMFSGTALEYLNKFTAYYHVASHASADYTGKGDLIDDLRTAIEDQRAVHILYQSVKATEPAFRDVYPLAVLDRGGVLYLIAVDPREEPPTIKHYKVVRIEAVELTHFKFPRPADFDPAAYMASSFGIYQGDDDILIKVRFAPKVARYVLETKKHASERLTKQRDGSVLAEYRLSSTNEIKSWILSFGPKAVVLEPESLRQEIVADLQALLTTYSSPRAPTRDRDLGSAEPRDRSYRIPKSSPTSITSLSGEWVMPATDDPGSKRPRPKPPFDHHED